MLTKNELEILLETFPTREKSSVTVERNGKFVIEIVATSFNILDEADRQACVSKFLRENYDEDELRVIEYIFTRSYVDEAQEFFDDAIEKFNNNQRSIGLDILAEGFDNAVLEQRIDFAKHILDKTIELVPRGELPSSSLILLLALSRPYRFKYFESRWTKLFDVAFAKATSDRGHIVAEELFGNLR